MRKLLFTLALLLSCSWALGQTKNMTDSIYMLNNVEVVAEKRVQKMELLNMNVPLKYLPITVTSIDNTTLDRKNIVDLEDVVRFLPGVSVTDQYGAFKRFSVRGTSDAVVMINGIRDERSLITSTPFDDLSSVESIEVIKGAASVLSGHSTMGGVINLITKKPKAEQSAYAKIGYGSWDVKQSTISFGGKIAGPVNYMANLYYSTGDGYRQVGQDRFSGMFTLGSQVGKGGYLEGSIRFNKDKYRTEIGSAPLMPGDVFSSADDKPFASQGAFNPMADYHTVYNDFGNNNMRMKNIDFSALYTQKITDWMSLRNHFNFGHRDLDYSAVENMQYRVSTDPIYDWYYINNKGVKTYIELDSLQTGTPLCFNPDTRSLSNTLELNGNFYIGNVKNNYSFGWTSTFLDYTQYNGYGKDDVWGPGLNQMVSLNNPQLVRDWWNSKISAASIRRFYTNGVFLNNVIDINDQWKAMVGGRFDVHKHQRATADIYDGTQHYHNKDRSEWTKVKTSAFTYRAGLVYYPVKSLSLYTSVASYFKPITTGYSKNVIYINSNGNEFNPDQSGGEVFKPEKGTQFEFGFRYELNEMLDLNGSVFYISKNNMVKRLGNVDVEEDGTTISKTVQGQVGRAKTMGFDFDVTFRPLPTLQVVAGCGFSDYRLRSPSINLDAYPNFSEQTNLRMTGIPRTTFFTYADYTIPKGILKNLSFHLSGNYTGKIYRNVSDDLYYPAKYLVDAGVYYTIKQQIRLSVVVNNVFDKEYFVKPTTLGKPTNFMASVSYTFR